MCAFVCTTWCEQKLLLLIPLKITKNKSIQLFLLCWAGKMCQATIYFRFTWRGANCTSFSVEMKKKSLENRWINRLRCLTCSHHPCRFFTFLHVRVCLLLWLVSLENLRFFFSKVNRINTPHLCDVNGGGDWKKERKTLKSKNQWKPKEGASQTTYKRVQGKLAFCVSIVYFFFFRKANPDIYNASTDS